MTIPSTITYVCLMICLPIVIALAAGHDPMAGYAQLAGMLMRAAEIGLEMRR